MRVPGDPDGCAALARELRRAAFEVSEAGSLPERSLLPADFWRGVAAGTWEQLTGRRGVRAGRLAQQLAAAARAVDGFAVRLAELQSQARRLGGCAAAEGLSMDATGSIAPVLVPMGPLISPESLAEQQRAQHRAEVRERLIRQVAALREEEDAAHRAVTGLLRGVGSPGLAEPLRDRPTAPSPGDSDEKNPWAPETGDGTAVLSLFTKGTLSSLRDLPPARMALGSLRTAPGLAVVGAGVGVRGDLADGRSLPGAVAKQAAVATASTAAGLGVGAALGLGAGGAAGAVGVAGAGAAAAVVAAPLVPVAVGVAAVIGVSIGVGYVGSRLWDMAFPVPDAKGASQRPAPSPPQVGPAPRRRGLPLDPTCGRGPVLPQVS